MRSLLDVNVLLAIVDAAHAHHSVARSWWRGHSQHGWASCPLTQNGFVRVITLPAYRNRLTIADAFATLARQLSLPGHEFWADDLSIADPSAFDRTLIQGPKQITDLYLLALAVKNGGRLVTFDRGIPLAAVRGATARHCVHPQVGLHSLSNT